MQPLPEDFTDERAFFVLSTKSDRIKDQYRAWIETVAAEEVDRVIAATPTAVDRTRLVVAAMEPFEKAYAIYQARDEAVPLDHLFSAYYRWWARQHAMMRA